MKASIGIGLIGCGRAGRIHARNFAGRISGARLVAVSDPAPDAARTTAEELGVDASYEEYEPLLENGAVDAVVVATPTNFHRDIVVAAAARGKHIFCEKPMALTVEECREMNEAVAAAGVKFQIGFMRRFDKSFREAKEAIDDGVIGDVVLVKSLTHGPSTPQRWMYDVAASNGPLAEVSSHDIDTLRWFTGGEAVEAYAIAGNYRCPDAREEFPEFYDNVVMTTRLSNGLQGVIEGAVSVGYGYDARVEILGTKGVLFVGSLNESRVSHCTVDRGIGATAVKSWRTLFIDAYEHEGQSFVDAIAGDSETMVGGIDGLRAVQIVNAGNESIRSRVPVAIDIN